MSNPADGDQGKIRSGGGRQGRPATYADSPDQTAGVRRDAATPLSHRPEDSAKETVPVDGRPHRLIPMDLDLLY